MNSMGYGRLGTETGPDRVIWNQSTLKPCPFCGGDVTFHPRPSEDLGYIICPKCTIKIKGYKDEITQIWNRRVNE